MKNDTTFVLMRSGDHLGDVKMSKKGTSIRGIYIIDLLPNYGPGTSKRYRKPVTTGNTVIFYCEKKNFRRSSDLAEAKIYLLAVLFIFDMHSTGHFFW